MATIKRNKLVPGVAYKSIPSDTREYSFLVLSKIPNKTHNYEVMMLSISGYMKATLRNFKPGIVRELCVSDSRLEETPYDKKLFAIDIT